MHPSLTELAVKVAKAKEEGAQAQILPQRRMARVPLQLSGAPDQAAAGAGPEAGDLHPLQQ